MIRLSKIEYLIYVITGKLPKKFGVRVKEGIWYDTYHNKHTGETFAFEKNTMSFFTR